eukprot:SAG25_NODE_84_length_16553_cov_5.346238_2_plen_332_part_00
MRVAAVISSTQDSRLAYPLGRPTQCPPRVLLPSWQGPDRTTKDGHTVLLLLPPVALGDAEEEEEDDDDGDVDEGEEVIWVVRSLTSAAVGRSNGLAPGSSVNVTTTLPPTKLTQHTRAMDMLRLFATSCATCARNVVWLPTLVSEVCNTKVTSWACSSFEAVVVLKTPVTVGLPPMVFGPPPPAAGGGGRLSLSPTETWKSSTPARARHPNVAAPSSAVSSSVRPSLTRQLRGLLPLPTSCASSAITTSCDTASARTTPSSTAPKPVPRIPVGECCLLRRPGGCGAGCTSPPALAPVHCCWLDLLIMAVARQHTGAAPARQRRVGSSLGLT